MSRGRRPINGNVTARPILPASARHQAATHLVGLGLYREAQDLLSIDQPEDAELGMLSSLLAGDPRTAAKFLGRRMMSSTARHGEVDLVRGCVALVSGHGEALDTTRQVLERMEPTSPDWAIFAVSAAPHNLRAAADAAASVTHSAGPAVLAVLAADRAAQGDAHGAHQILDSARWTGVGDDPTQRTIDLLKTHGHESAVPELEAAHWQRRPLGESLSRRMDRWRRRRNERDLRCRCATTPTWAGEGSRYYVNWHLELLEHGETQGWRILFCAETGIRYLDQAVIPVSVRIGAFSEPIGSELE